MRHVNNFNREINGGTKIGNSAKVQVPPDFLKKFRYKKMHFVIIHVSFENFILLINIYVHYSN